MLKIECLLLGPKVHTNGQILKNLRNYMQNCLKHNFFPAAGTHAMLPTPLIWDPPGAPQNAPFFRSIFGIDFGPHFGAKRSPNGALFRHFWHPKSMQKAMHFSRGPKVASGTQTGAVWTPPTRKIIKKQQVL